MWGGGGLKGGGGRIAEQSDSILKGSFNSGSIGAEIGSGFSHLSHRASRSLYKGGKGSRCRRRTAQTLGATFEIVTVMNE